MSSLSLKPIVLVLVVSLLGVGPAQAQNKTTIAVLSLSANGVEPSVAENLSQLVASSLTELGAFDVLSRQDIERMVQFEADKQALGCESDTSCLAELGGALGVALLITGSIGRVGDTYLLSLNLVDTQAGRVRMREQRKVASANALTDETSGAARYLVRELLAGQQGYLVLRVSEAGADIEIDGKLVGVAPIARTALAGGPHRLRVNKKGFVSWSRDIAIAKEDTSVQEAELLPSQEFIQAYEDDASLWRLGAYTTGGLGIALIAASGYAYFGYNASRADAYNQDVSAAGCSPGSGITPSVDCQATFGSRHDDIASLDTWSRIGMGVGAVALGTGLFFYLRGPTPGIYDQYRTQADAGAQVAVLPMPGGVQANVMLPLSW